ncbi:MAG TPA: MBL fold metallo-hydrolase [Promineifilum sp.]|nr:MBL fold metallo-hydrolase [Promineifilum sp.]
MNNSMDIQILDTHFQGMAQVTAVYLLVGPDGPVLIETGPGSTLPAVISALAAQGFRPRDIKHVLLTHIHLDHAGAAGWWARQGAQIYVHHVGAPHLIDPSKLLASATRIYGDRMDMLWGEFLSAPAEKVTPLYDGDIVRAGGLTFTALDTPGHAYHHHTYIVETGVFLENPVSIASPLETGVPGRNPVSRIAFTGDAAGVRLPQFNVVDLPAPPPEFHLETWLGTLDRLEAAAAGVIYPTHFGPIRDIHGHLSQLRTLMVDAVAFVEARLGGLEDLTGSGKPVRSVLLEEYIAWNRARAAAMNLSPTAVESYELANPLFMSVDGILRYLRKRG